MLSELEAQGTLIRLKPQSFYTQRKGTGSVRGKITTFSRKARARLIEKMARLDVEKVRTVFLTLTFHGTPDAAEARAAFRRFTARLNRKFPRMSAMWRKEFQERGAAHFHLICFNMPYWKQDAIQRTWQECTKEDRSIVHVKLLRNKRQAMYYVSKYIAKFTPDAENPSLDNTPYQHDASPASIGRQWGYLGKVRLPMARIRRAYLIDDDTVRYLRFAMRARSRGKSNKWSPTTTLYADDVNAMFEFALRAGGFEREPDDLISFASVLAGEHPSPFLAAQYATREAWRDWKAETDFAYKRLEQEFWARHAKTKWFK